ncbi:uncharacterized protein METZ01_LOCUS174399, partial [marine metagenome]
HVLRPHDSLDGLPEYHRGDHPQSADQSCVGGLLAAAAEWGDETVSL